MSLLGIILALIVVGVVVHLVPMEPTIKHAIVVLVLLVAAFVLIEMFFPGTIKGLRF